MITIPEMEFQGGLPDGGLLAGCLRQQLAGAGRLAEKINADGLALYADVPYCCGTAGTTPGELADLAAARRALNVQKAPASSRVAVWDPEADAKFTQLAALVNAEKAGSSQALREGAIGRVYGMDNYMSQAVRQHATGIEI